MIENERKAFSGAFRISFWSANDALKTASFDFVEQSLMVVAQNGALDDVFDHSIKRWTQSSAFIDELARRVIRFSCFFGPVARLIRKNLGE